MGVDAVVLVGELLRWKERSRGGARESSVFGGAASDLASAQAESSENGEALRHRVFAVETGGRKPLPHF